MQRYTNTDRALMVSTYLETRSISKTVALLGCGSGTVQRALKVAGVATRRSGGQRKEIGDPPKWGRRIASNGYAMWFGWVPGENRYQVILEHRLVMERRLGRPLLTREQVHHRNGVRDDNRDENLDLRVGNHGSGASHCPHCGGAL